MRELDTFSELVPAKQVFFAVSSVESRVNGDGFHGWLVTCPPVAIRMTPSALKEIGAVKTAVIVEQAISLVTPYLGDDDDWEGAANEVYDQDEDCGGLETLDQRFYAYEEDLTELLFAFVRKYPDIFGPAPVVP
jgi:hypothetical protein